MFSQFIADSLLANTTLGIEVSSCDGRILEGNPAFCRFVGYDRQALLGMPVDALCHEAEWERERLGRQEMIAGRTDHVAFRKRYLTSAGKTVWGDCSLTAVRDADGNCQALLAMVSDITEQRRLQMLQQGQNQVLDLLYRDHTLEEVCAAIVKAIEAVEEGLLCSILQLDPVTGRLHKLAAPSLPDFYNEAIEGMVIGDGIGSCGTAAFRKERVIVTDILAHPYWVRARRLVERTRLRSCWSQPIFANDGAVIGTFAIYYTEPRHPGPFELQLITAAAELTALAINHKQALNALRQSDRLKSEFISIAAHELRTPITSIMGFAELLVDPATEVALRPEQRQRFLHEIIEDTERLGKIIDDILDLSWIDSGRNLPLRREMTDLGALLARVINRFGIKASHHFVLDVRPGLPPALLIDSHRISQVLDNLLNNAVKYSAPGTRITVTAGCSGGSCEVVVADQGIGMTREQVARIFETFYRADASNAAVRGLGLGMGIVKRIVEDHGGTIRVDSAPGQGCRVHFTLPLTDRGSSPRCRDSR
ncbi:MAG: PAS domain S-box protein [Deltaproteobacteria bacterium]|nr:MAG: PAS domain S-box protein [Deltaproteobacteria bacterium]